MRMQRVRVASVKRFVAHNALYGNKQTGAARFDVSIDGTFSWRFKDTIDENVPAMRLRAQPIGEAACDSKILRRFGGRRKLAMPLAHLFSFLPHAKKYEAYHFYIYDTRRELHSVHLEYPLEDWDYESGESTGERWEFRAHEIDCMDTRIDGYVVYPEYRYRTYTGDGQ